MATEDMGYETVYRPGRPVWLDLAKVYPVETTDVCLPDGLNLQERVPALMKIRGRTTTGHRIAWVSYKTGDSGHGAVPHGQWVLWDAVSDRDEPDPPSRSSPRRARR